LQRHRAGNQPIRGDPGGIPAFEGFPANFTLETVDFSGFRHGFGTTINRTAFTGSMAGF
jgi:hypothetical protein